jgi:hypothetical protein
VIDGSGVLVVIWILLDKIIEVNYFHYQDHNADKIPDAQGHNGTKKLFHIHNSFGSFVGSLNFGV